MNQEWLAIERSDHVITKDDLVRDLRDLGAMPGMTLIVHSSLSQIGWVNGGPVTVVHALMEVLTEQGTLVMPTHSGEYSDPANWQHPPVPSTWWDTIRDTMPAFHPMYTPCRGMGRVPETFRSFPGVVRSSHPALSFAAWGRHARLVTDDHGLDFGLGEQSPLARIYDLDGNVLLLGVGFDSNTSFHLSQYRSSAHEEQLKAAPVFVDGTRVWKTYREIELDTDGFEDLGRTFEAAGQVIVGKIGVAESRLFRQRDAVDYGRGWLNGRKAGVESGR